MDDIEQEIDLDQITDESLLQSLLDQTDDPDDRKVIRERIKELRAQQAAANAAAKKEADEKLAKLTNTREEMLKKKQAEAEAQKQRTMQMYDNMQKSAPAGANKQMDQSILRTETKETKKTTTTTTTSSSKTMSSPNPILANMPLTFGPRGDMVEDAIKKRQREAEERKAKILAAYDIAAKSAPAGANRDVDFDVCKTIDVSTIEKTKVESGATFQMNGGVPIVKVPRTPTSPLAGQKPAFPDDSHLDAYERSLRERQRECEERKRAMLEKYSQVSSQKAGPKVFV